jgi:uncharacterized membrane protein
MLSLFIKAVKAIPEWKLLLSAGVIFLVVAFISFLFHLKTPKERRSKGIMKQPFVFMLLVDIVVILLAYILYLLDI